MARNRVIYQSEALYVGPDATSGHYAVPLTVAVQRHGVGTGQGFINLTTSQTHTSTDLAPAGTTVKLSGIYTHSLPSITNSEAFLGVNKLRYSSINANFGEVAANTVDGMSAHNGGTRIVNRIFPASGSKLIAQTDGATGIAVMLPEPLTSIPLTGYSGAAGVGDVTLGSGFTGYIPVTNRVTQLMRVQSANYGFDIGRNIYLIPFSLLLLAYFILSLGLYA